MRRYSSPSSPLLTTNRRIIGNVLFSGSNRGNTLKIECIFSSIIALRKSSTGSDIGINSFVRQWSRTLYIEFRFSSIIDLRKSSMIGESMHFGKNLNKACRLESVDDIFRRFSKSSFPSYP